MSSGAASLANHGVPAQVRRRRAKGGEMNDDRETIHAPGWFAMAAIAAVLFEAFGVYSYLTHVTTDPHSLPIDQRDLVLAMPGWMTAAYAVAVWAGLAGALLLLVRRRQAAPLLLLSLLAAIVQFGALLVDPALRNLVGSDDLLVPFVILVVCYAVWHLAWQARRWGWLR
jgi:hypothetical protein